MQYSRGLIVPIILLRSVKDSDRISLVTYDTHVELVFGLMKMDKQNKERAKTIIQSINDGSSTNLCGGLLKGQKVLLNKSITSPISVGGLPKLQYIVGLFKDNLLCGWLCS